MVYPILKFEVFIRKFLNPKCYACVNVPCAFRNVWCWFETLNPPKNIFQPLLYTFKRPLSHICQCNESSVFAVSIFINSVSHCLAISLFTNRIACYIVLWNYSINVLVVSGASLYPTLRSWQVLNFRLKTWLLVLDVNMINPLLTNLKRYFNVTHSIAIDFSNSAKQQLMSNLLRSRWGTVNHNIQSKSHFKRRSYCLTAL